MLSIQKALLLSSFLLITGCAHHVDLTPNTDKIKSAKNNSINKYTNSNKLQMPIKLKKLQALVVVVIKSLIYHIRTLKPHFIQYYQVNLKMYFPRNL